MAKKTRRGKYNTWRTCPTCGQKVQGESKFKRHQRQHCFEPMPSGFICFVMVRGDAWPVWRERKDIVNKDGKRCLWLEDHEERRFGISPNADRREYESIIARAACEAEENVLKWRRAATGEAAGDSGDNAQDEDEADE